MKVYKITIEIPEGWVAVCEWNEHRGQGGAKGKYDALSNRLGDIEKALGLIIKHLGME